MAFRFSVAVTVTVTVTVAILAIIAVIAVITVVRFCTARTAITRTITGSHSGTKIIWKPKINVCDSSLSKYLIPFNVHHFTAALMFNQADNFCRLRNAAV